MSLFRAPTDATNYRKSVPNFFSSWLANRQWYFLTSQSWRVLKSWYTGHPEQGFRRCFADGLNQSLASSIAQTIGRSGSTFWTLPKHGKKQFSPLLLSINHSCRIAVLLSKSWRNWSQRHQTVNKLSQSNFHWADDSSSFTLIFTLIGQASDGMQSFTWDNGLVNGQFDY